MLIELRIKNCLSIQDEQVLSLVASNDKSLEVNTFQVAGLTLLKSVAIYGANAAGKSNIIKIMGIIKEIILSSASTQRGTKLPLIPFLLGENKNDPSELEISFIADDVKYRYGFSATKEKVLEEWLFAYPNKRAQKWFLRAYDEKNDTYKYEFGSKFLGEKRLWESSTRENALFLSTAIQLNSKQLRPIFDWFASRINMCTTGGFGNALDITVDKFKESPEEILKFLKEVDLDIENINIREEEVELGQLPPDLANGLKSVIPDSDTKKIKQINVATTHLNQQGEPVEFDMQLESDGTRRLFEFSGIILDVLQIGSILVIDELHTHLHPLMTQFLIKLFHNPNKNPKNAQLIFTTHETSLLTKDIFREDQIYFCEKQNKATQLYAISDFKGLRENSNLEKLYLLGRFGALPNLG